MNIKVQGHSDSTFSNFFFLETAKPIKAKFQMEPSWDTGTKVCSNGPGHMTNMAARPVFDKNLEKFPVWNQKAMSLKVDMQHRVLEYYQACSNDDPGLTLTYFTARSNLFLYAFVWKIVKTIDFSETIVIYGYKLVDAVNLNEYMKLYE